jgi:uncharacterized protein YbjT (DUF2867 family)
LPFALHLYIIKNRSIMKIVVTGSLGHISKPLAEQLVKNGHNVTVVSSSPERIKDIEALGAKAAIGTMQDVKFLTSTFTGADIVYLMESLGHNFFFDHNLDVREAVLAIGKNYKEAVQKSGVKKIIHLSSIGAHMKEGNGMLAFHYDVENVFNELPSDVKIKFMRPVGFYYNMLQFIPTIKNTNAIIQNYGGDDKEPWVSPLDIADVIAEEIEKPFEGRTIRYIASDELSPNEIAKTLGTAIGNPDLKWTTISDDQLLANLTSIGMNPKTAKGFVEMNMARRGGVLYEDYFRNRPVLSKRKVKDFAKEFAAVYNKQ